MPGGCVASLSEKLRMLLAGRTDMCPLRLTSVVLEALCRLLDTLSRPRCVSTAGLTSQQAQTLRLRQHHRQMRRLASCAGPVAP